jgi:hypothetical protein
MEGVERLSLVAKVLMDTRLLELKRENEALKMQLFWRDHSPSMLNQAMAASNKMAAGPRCACLACIVGGRCEDGTRGCLLLDLRAFDVIAPPWFYYEYADAPYNTRLASTEDVVLTRNADWLGISQYANWDAWANHHKSFEAEKPRLCPVDAVPRAIWDGYKAGAKPRLITPSES